jgi:alginate O-acetyltransferase complex protein AlgI
MDEKNFLFFHRFNFMVFFAVVFALYWSLPGLVRWWTQWRQRRHNPSPDPLPPLDTAAKSHNLQMYWLVIASCIFYMSYNPWLILLILFSASVDYCVALHLPKVTIPWRRKFWLCFSITINLSLLAFYKYANFLLYQVFDVLGFVGLEGALTGLPMEAGKMVKATFPEGAKVFHTGFLEIALPLGISFYTFETISYIVDVYLGRIQPVKSLRDYALYIMFFPHLMAGPIVRPREFLPQVNQRKRFDWDRFQLGLQYFLIGLFKKAVIADTVGAVVDVVFADPAGLATKEQLGYSTGAIWFAVLCYAVQIYCDFSGYSDMGIGLAHMLGFKLPFNFDMPYFSLNITEFWRRWHISLSSWLRDYLYIPLGGNRYGTWLTYRNLILTMFLGGLWHGANWTFVVWGLYHGLLLSLHRAVPLPKWVGQTWCKPFSAAFTFVLVCVGWVFFRAQSFTTAGIVLQRMFWPTPGMPINEMQWVLCSFLMGLVLLAHLAGTFGNLKSLERRLPAPALGAYFATVILLAMVLTPVDSRGFIYFQF